MNGVPLARVLSRRTLAYREPLECWTGAAQLCASIRRHGVLDPVTLVEVPDGLLPVAGFRRLAALRELERSEVPARVEQGDPGPLFVRAVEAHAGQPVGLREVARALRVGTGELGFSLERAARLLLPPLGLQPHPELARRYLQLLELPAELLQLMVDKGFSLRRSLPFCNLGPAATGVVSQLVRCGLVRGGRELEQVTDQLLEVSAREGLDPGELARELGLVGAATAEGLRRLAARRLPRVTRLREELDRLCEALADGRLEARYDRNFTSEQIELVLRVSAPGDLDTLCERLSGEEARAVIAAMLERVRP